MRRDCAEVDAYQVSAVPHFEHARVAVHFVDAPAYSDGTAMRADVAQDNLHCELLRKRSRQIGRDAIPRHTATYRFFESDDEEVGLGEARHRDAIPEFSVRRLP